MSVNDEYRSAENIDNILLSELNNFLSKERLSSIATYKTLDSTNSFLKRSNTLSLPTGFTVIAKEQTAGRGRNGRSFISTGAGIYMSSLMRVNAAQASALQFTAISAVCVCHALEKVCGVSPQIKWVNDIIVESKKICGILCEAKPDASGEIGEIIIGIGVNVNQEKGYFKGELNGKASSIFGITGSKTDIARLCAQVILELDNINSSDNKKYLEEYRSRLMGIGQKIIVKQAYENKEAYCLGLNDDYSLEVEYQPDGHRESISSGEVSIRSESGYC